MKVILTEDIYKHGVAGEVVDVADGFARNYLIPQGMAMKVTPGALKRSAHLRAEAEKRRKRRDDELQQLAEKIEALTLAFPVKAGETGKLYGSVTTRHIAEALEEALGISIDHRRVGEQPLRELGEHEVAVRLSSTLSPPVKVLVHREDEPPESVLGVRPIAGAEEEAEADAPADVADAEETPDEESPVAGEEEPVGEGDAPAQAEDESEAGESGEA